MYLSGCLSVFIEKKLREAIQIKQNGRGQGRVRGWGSVRGPRSRSAVSVRIDFNGYLLFTGIKAQMYELKWDGVVTKKEKCTPEADPQK